ncbi:MAG: hypothetical protein ACI4NM_11965 [Bullifex sp.]
MTVSRAIEQRVQLAVQKAREEEQEKQKKMQAENLMMQRQLLECYVTMIKSNIISRESAALLLKMTPEEFDWAVSNAGLSI